MDKADMRIELTVDSRWLGVFGRLLSEGFFLAVQTGVSVEALLCEQVGIDANYLANRIQTVFLDNQAVDDVGQAVVRDGSVVALSAAMPGLVGAVMRRGGLYAGLRSGISYRPATAQTAFKPGTIRLKLFNLVAKELGPGFLVRGIRVNGRAFDAFLRGQPDDFKLGIAAARVNGRALQPAALFSLQLPPEDIHLLVNVR